MWMENKNCNMNSLKKKLQGRILYIETHLWTCIVTVLLVIIWLGNATAYISLLDLTAIIILRYSVNPDKDFLHVTEVLYHHIFLPVSSYVGFENLWMFSLSCRSSI